MAKKTPTKKDDLAVEWRGRIEKASRFMDKYTTRSRWPEFRKYYRGEWDASILPVNRIYAFGRTLIPNVYFRSPRVCITATRPEFVWHARIVESIDNWLIRELLLKDTLKDGTLDAYLTGTGPIKIGYDSEFGYLPEQAIDRDSGTATEFSRKDGTKIEYRANIKSGMPWALNCDPDDIIIPAGYRTASSLPWICHRIFRPLDDVKQDQKYQNTDKLVGTKLLNISSKGNTNKFGTGELDETKYAELFEIRDVRTGSILTICEDIVLLNAPDAVAIEGLPYEFIIFNKDPEFFHGVSDVKIIEQQQLELNEAKTQEKKHREIALMKFLYKKGALTKEQLNHFLSGEVGPAVEMDIDEAISNAITILQPHVPPDFAILEKRIDENMRQILGYSANQMADFSGYHGKTAAESMIVNQANELRMNERKDILGDVLINIVRKWNQLIFKYWTDQKVIEIVGPRGQQYWVEYTGDQLTGEYFMSMDPESGMPMTRSMKMEMMGTLMKTFNGDPMIDQQRLRLMALRQHDWVDPEASSLLLQGPMSMGQDIAALRQPGPVYGGGGATGGPRPGSGPGPGGGAGSSPSQPAALEQMASKMPGGR